MGTVVALAGQAGGAKLADGLYRLLGRNLTVIVNTGDDFEHLGLAFSPDLDAILYALSGMAGAGTGYEPSGETYAFYETLVALGGPDRPRLGDRSLALPMLRADGLRNERTPTELALELARHLRIEARVLPMTDDPVRTQILTEDGPVSFQDYFFQLGCEPLVRGFEFPGAGTARIADELLSALHAPDLDAVVICPGNPYHCIGPILAVNGMRELLRRCGAPVIAVTPVAGARGLMGSTAKMMRDLGREASARGVALEYHRLIDGFVIDVADADHAEGIRACDIEVLPAQTIMRTIDDRTALARGVLEFAQRLRSRAVTATAP